MISDWLHFTPVGSRYVMRKAAPELIAEAGLADAP
jgi:hypothetical protein